VQVRECLSLRVAAVLKIEAFQLLVSWQGDTFITSFDTVSLHRGVEGQMSWKFKNMVIPSAHRFRQLVPKQYIAAGFGCLVYLLCHLMAV
jgi:hypothetical protein